MQKRGLNLWHGKDFFAPTASVCQPLFETSEKNNRRDKFGVRGVLECSKSSESAQVWCHYGVRGQLQVPWGAGFELMIVLCSVTIK